MLFISRPSHDHHSDELHHHDRYCFGDDDAVSIRLEMLSICITLIQVQVDDSVTHSHTDPVDCYHHDYRCHRGERKYIQALSRRGCYPCPRASN